MLAQSGTFEVTFVARGAHLQAMQSMGLRVTGKADIHIHPAQAVSTSPSEAPFDAPDWVIVAVKSFDTDGAIDYLKRVCGKQTQFLTLQNGLENYDKLVEAFGSERVVRGFCRLASEVTEPGVITFRGLSEVVIGEEDGSNSNRVLQLQKILEEAGINNKVSGEIKKKAWLKFVWNAVFNMLTGLGNTTIDRLYDDREAYATAWELFYEMQAVARGEGVVISDKEGEAIIDGSKSLGAFRTSTFQDRQKGKPLEYDAFCGYVVRRAEAADLRVPVHRTLYALYKLIEQPQTGG